MVSIDLALLIVNDLSVVQVHCFVFIV